MHFIGRLKTLQVLAAIDGDPSSGFAARDKYITDPSKLGPLLDGEYYTLAPDVWGSENPHNVAKDGDITRFVDDLDWVLGANNSISLYVCAMSLLRMFLTRASSLTPGDVPWGHKLRSGKRLYLEEQDECLHYELRLRLTT